MRVIPDGGAVTRSDRERGVRRWTSPNRGRRLALALVGLLSLVAPPLAPTVVATSAHSANIVLASQSPVERLRGPAEVAGTDGEGLRVRRAADPQADVLAVLDEGARVEVLDGPLAGGGVGWYRIRYGDAGGWVAARYLRALGARDAEPASAQSTGAAAPASAARPASPPDQLAADAFARRSTADGGRVGRLVDRLPGVEASAPAPAALPAALIVPPSVAPIASLPVRPLPPVENRDPRFGLVEAFRLAETGLDRALGARYQRLTFWWRGLQPAPGAPLNSFYFPQELLDHELGQGYQVIGTILNTPDWAAANPSEGPRSVPANLHLDWDDPRNHWGRFAERLARDYAGRVNDWIIWNEPDIQPGDPNAAYYTWAGSLDDYYQLLRVGYRAIKAGNPAARVHLAGLTYWSDRRAGRTQYFERLLDRVLADPSAAAHNHYFDRVTLHLYTDPRGLYHVPRLYRELMQARGLDKPIWINETNVIPWDEPTNRGTGYDVASGMRCTLADQASYVLQAFGLGLAGGAERISFYKAEDGVGAALNPWVDAVERSALVREDGSLRPAFLAYQTVVRYLGGAERAEYFPSSTVEAVVLDRRGGLRTTVLWNAASYPVAARVRRTGSGVALVDGVGRQLPLSPDSEDYVIALPPATCNTDPDDPTRYLTGGETYLLVESDVPVGRQPAAPLPERLPPPALRAAGP